MGSRARTILLWLFVINLGIALGAGVYEGQIVVPDWIGTSSEAGAQWDADAARSDNTGVRFWVGVTTIPLTLLTLANLLLAVRASGTLRRWWLVASGAALADRIFTFAYFIPTMVALMNSEDSREAVETARQWASLNHIRHAIVLAALLAALKTFARLYEQRGTRS